MKLGIYSVYDSMAKAFLPPFYMHNDSLAIRAITECLMDDNHKFCKHPQDYTLFKFGHYEDTDGEFDIFEAHKSLAPLITLQQLQEDPIPAQPPTEITEDGIPVQ